MCFACLHGFFQKLSFVTMLAWVPRTGVNIYPLYLPLVFTSCIYPLIVYNISVKTTLDETNNRE